MASSMELSQILSHCRPQKTTLWLENWASSMRISRSQNAECSEGKIKGRPAKNLLEQLPTPSCCPSRTMASMRLRSDAFVCGHTFSIAHAMSWSIRHNEILLTEVCHSEPHLQPMRACPANPSIRKGPIESANLSSYRARKNTPAYSDIQPSHHHTTSPLIYWRRCNNFYCHRCSARRDLQHGASWASRASIMAVPGHQETDSWGPGTPHILTRLSMLYFCQTHVYRILAITGC